MDTEKLLGLVKKYNEQKEFITNEETTKMALVVPFIELLGYDANNPREVRLEYAAEFTQGDGKKLADRMDFAIFDQTGTLPRIVIEAKPLGTDLKAKAQQLARYIAQLNDLHFGIITDGCHYLFFGDLENPNQMDQDPFFKFSLDDRKTDWAKVAKFLDKFGRKEFNADTLITDAENSRYRQEIIDKLARALRSPAEDENFLKWLTDGIYKGMRTSKVMARLGEVAKDAVEPALLKVMGDDFVEKLRNRIQLAKTPDEPPENQKDEVPIAETVSEGDSDTKKRPPIETTGEELELFNQIKQICSQAGFNQDDIILKDTASYLNISFQKPTKWFVRFFSSKKTKAIVTLVPCDEAKGMCDGFEVDSAPSAFGQSRIYINNAAQAWALRAVIQRSLEILTSIPEQTEGPESQND